MRNKRFDFLHLPEKSHQKHRYCEFLLYQIEDFILKDTYGKLKNQIIQFDKEPILIEGEHILDYLIRVGEYNKHDEIVISNILVGMISDICQFLQVALFSSLQQRLTVTFALIRKPFVYNLLIILRLYFDDNFLNKFNKEKRFDTTELSQEQIKELLNISENVLLTEVIKASDIYNIIFNPSDPDSIVNLSNKALHPSTTRNKYNLTDLQNINFVFSTVDNLDTQWNFIYSKLPLLFLYMNELLEFIIFDHLKIEDSVYTERLTERAEFFKNNAYV